MELKPGQEKLSRSPLLVDEDGAPDEEVKDPGLPLGGIKLVPLFCLVLELEDDPEDDERDPDELPVEEIWIVRMVAITVVKVVAESWTVLVKEDRNSEKSAELEEPTVEALDVAVLEDEALDPEALDAEAFDAEELDLEALDAEEAAAVEELEVVLVAGVVEEALELTLDSGCCVDELTAGGCVEVLEVGLDCAC